MTDAQAHDLDPAQVTSSGDLPPPNKRKKLLKIVAILFIVAVLIYALWMYFASRSVSTDNAYVGADTAQITSMVSGQVTEVLVKDTQQVKQGDVLVRIDPRDAKIALVQAQAELAKAKRQYNQTSANSQSLNSQVSVRADEIASAQAQVKKAEADLAKAQADYERRRKLSETGAISKEEMSSAQTVLDTARA
ncbi:MAG TPA: EmrA/EmrK family multidrug efflux transporter periplasmic adaptor subunit, partial [Acinetobacter radioresistens]|nr:EmrA/EmrK family multidrug efflux transporter periplasmic adaptor subunit [Acinetobacter radioresistens]